MNPPPRFFGQGETSEIPQTILAATTARNPRDPGGVITERPRVNQRIFSPLVYLHGDTNVNG